MANLYGLRLGKGGPKNKRGARKRLSLSDREPLTRKERERLIRFLEKSL